MPESQETSASLAVPADGPEEMNTNIPLEIPSLLIDGEKPKRKRRKRSRKGRFIDEISIDEVMKYSHLPSRLAAEELGIGVTSLKRICRAHGIKEWTYKGETTIRHHSDPFPREESTKNETMLRTQTSPFYERFLEDHMAAQAFTLHLDEAGREEMADTLDELFDISASLRQNLGFSILNESVMLTLLEKVDTWNT